MSKKNRKHKKEGMKKGLDMMIRCPLCGGFSYPLQFENPSNEVEENAIICASCKRDLYPIMVAIEDMKKKQEEEAEKAKNPPETNNTN